MEMTISEMNEFWAMTKRAALRVVRSGLLAAIAVWLASAQSHIDYSEWRIALLVFLLGALNRFQWIAGVLVLWLVMLYLVPPEMVAGMKALRG